MHGSINVAFQRQDHLISQTRNRHGYTSSEYEDYQSSVISECDSGDPIYRDVKLKPVFSTPLMNRTITENTSVKLTCNIIGNHVSVKWLKNSQPLRMTPRHKSHCENGLATLEIFSVNSDDAAEYTCVARNVHGEVSSSSHLKVIDGYEKSPMPPIFTRAMKGKCYI